SGTCRGRGCNSSRRMCRSRSMPGSSSPMMRRSAKDSAFTRHIMAHPPGYVLVEYTKSFRQEPSRVFSHEVLEMVIDPTATRTVNISNVLYLIEPGDILAFDAGGYEINGVLVSGFATPAYYRLDSGTRYW